MIRALSGLCVPAWGRATIVGRSSGHAGREQDRTDLTDPEHPRLH